MKTFLSEVFEYHHHFNQKIINQFIEYEPILTDLIITSFSHILNAHQIWNARILNLPEFEVHQMHTLDTLHGIDGTNYLTTKKIIKHCDLKNEIEYQNSKGNTFKNSVQDILFHISNHSTHHKGQVIMALRQLGIVPVATDYIFYKR